jgi:hypothetical protein
MPRKVQLPNLNFGFFCIARKNPQHFSASRSVVMMDKIPDSSQMIGELFIIK